MKQKFTLTAAILTLIEFVCLCVPFSLVEVIYYRSSNGIGHTPTYFNNTNIFDIWSSKGRLMGALLAIMLLASFALFLLDYLQKNPLSKITPWLPVLGAVMLGYFTMYASELATINDGDVIYRWRLGWLFYVAILLHVVSVLLAILIRFKKDDTSKSTAGKSE